MATQLPTKAQLTAKGVTKGAFRAATNQLIDYLTGLLGITGDVLDARAALQQVASFAPLASLNPDMNVRIDKGNLLVDGGLIVKAVQTVSAFVPSGTNQRIDRIVVNTLTGVASRVAGTDSASPVAPAIALGFTPICQVGPFTTTTSIITQSMITDERPVLTPPVGVFGFKNRLINPDGAIAQRGLVSTVDDVYFADRWYILTQTAAVLPSALSEPEDNFPVGTRITQSQAAAQRFGFAQIIEAKNCKDLRGRNGVLVPRVRISTSQAIRYAILGWTGTEDTVTSDVVNDWTSGVYTVGNFFATNATPLVVGAQTPSANVWTSLAAITAALGSSFKNIIIVVWTEGTAVQNLTLDFDYVQFERGVVPTEFERRSIQHELQLCQRYYGKTFNQGVTPVQAVGNTAGCISSVAVNGAVDATSTWQFPVEMRVAPTIVTFNPFQANANWRNSANTADDGANVSTAGTRGVVISGSGVGLTAPYTIHATADAEL